MFGMTSVQVRKPWVRSFVFSSGEDTLTCREAVPFLGDHAEIPWRDESLLRV